MATAETSRIGDLLRRLRRKARGTATDVRYAHRQAMGPPEGSQPIRTRTYTVLDCEMTGLDPTRDEILSIGAIRIRNHRIEMRERFYQVFKPVEAVSPKEIILIHGLGPDEVGRGLPLAAALEQLLAFIGDSVVVGHCVDIDLGFLDAALAAHGRKPLKNPAVDTRLLHQWWRRTAGPAAAPGAATDPSLEEIVKELGLPRYPLHHAFYDALTTGLVFLKLVGEFEASGAVQFRALYREAGVY
jgi:DNA polymerase-3 subunit epsilon